MRKTKNMILLSLLTLLFTGCMKYNVTMDISDDKSVKMEAISAVDLSMFEGMAGDGESSDFEDEEDYYYEDELEEDTTEESNENAQFDVKSYEFLKSKGYTVEEYKEKTDDGELVGVKVSKKFKNIDDISKEKEKKIDFVNFFNEEGFDDSQIFSKSKDVYKATFVFDFTSEEEGDMDYSQYDSYFDLEYKITLPHKAISSNATKVSDDGKTLTWDLKYGKVNNVNFEFSFEGESSSLLLFIVFAVAGIVVVGFVIFFIVKSKNKDKKITTPEIIEENNRN